MTTDGNSKPKSFRLKIIKPVWQNLVIKEPLPPYLIKTRKISSSNDIYQLFRYLSRETKEHFLALHLDAKHKIICVDQVSVGSLSACLVNPREVMKSCMLSSCSALALVHNHPSNDPTASAEDISITTRLKECCELFSIRLLDHVIVCENEYCSLADRGILS